MQHKPLRSGMSTKVGLLGHTASKEIDIWIYLGKPFNTRDGVFAVISTPDIVGGMYRLGVTSNWRKIARYFVVEKIGVS